MMQIKSIDNCDFIISIDEIYLIKSNGNKTVFFLRGFEKPIYTEHSIKDMAAFLSKRGILKGTASTDKPEIRTKKKNVTYMT